MSSFLVSDKTINNIVTGLTSHNWTDGLMWEYPFRDIIKDDEDFNTFGKRLIKLNHKALGQRYGDKLKEEIVYNFEFKSTSIIQFLKNLECFLYQCSEGKVVKTKLFKDLTKVARAFNSKIVSDMEEYKTAEWGF